MKIDYSLNFDLFQPPTPSTRSPVTGYIVSHNATGTVQVYLTNNTQFFISVIPSEMIVLTVTATSVLGSGKQSCFTSELKLTLLLQLGYLKGIHC